MSIQLTKTDFKEYLICPKWVWLKKNDPDKYKSGGLNLFLQKLIREGYEVERYAREMFPEGEFQAEFKTADGLLAKIDILTRIENPESRIQHDIYEVKSSSEIKTDLLHNHIKDITFQTIVAERAGVKVGKSYIIHMNKEYVRDGDINVYELFTVEDVTERVAEEKEQVSLLIDEALEYLKKKEINMNACPCLQRSSGQRCDNFATFNSHVPKYGVHNLFIGNKLKDLVEQGIFEINDIPEDFKLTDIQQTKVDLQKSQRPQIDEEAIKETLDKLVFPLYFFDYETLPKPIPMLDGYRPHQQLVFQFSLHILQKDNKLEHFEYLAEDVEHATKGAVESLKGHLGPIGSVIVWYEAFEKGRNLELAELHPESKDFFLDMNNRIFDLMKPFKKDYLHPDFKGSASIKNVLPVIVPELSYKNLDIQNGTMAMTEWEKIVLTEVSDEESSFDSPRQGSGQAAQDKQKTREGLLKYCELDTFAMVEIYKFLRNL
jgi:CRISPR/Cas system-associated exonuclease Cas4 (RecB family)